MVISKENKKAMKWATSYIYRGVKCILRIKGNISLVKTIKVIFDLNLNDLLERE